ncbi:uncharacterized protein [Prorops nasuta]|uniref:uncharacterized protein n=1 Tax=Prorops nasuta TaxID=863751 RepID=UPI0034CEE4DF
MSWKSWYALFCLIGVVLAAPAKKHTRSVVPSWHRPCRSSSSYGFAYSSVEEEETSSQEYPDASVEDIIRERLDILKLQHQMTLEDYLVRDYEYFYEKVRIGIRDHQYIPNWLPGKSDAASIRRLRTESQQMIANHFPKLYTDLQKFAVALEQLFEDETDAQLAQALDKTQASLKTMLCEVENSIDALTTLTRPINISRSIMTYTERNPIDDTRRLVRDWGVLLKYRDYLHAWKHVFDY